MKVTIIGCGNAGLIHAAKIYEKGDNEVCLLKTSQTNSAYYDKIVAEGGYSCPRFDKPWQGYYC